MKIKAEEWIKIEITELDATARGELEAWILKYRPARRIYIERDMILFNWRSNKKEVDL
jgi:hypothetical protein